MITATVGDITDEGAVRSWVAKVSDALGEGGLDVLISNAGSLTPGPLERSAGAYADRLIDIVEREPVPLRASLDGDIESMLHLLREKLAATRGEPRLESDRYP
ncbi:hypothetical protein [Streptomyces coeruleorubidus]|uniref:hypothetical protein n=1 Tax=Streptomyces coeruleorubidus TaxID=116188 RepID=UPI0036A0C395